MVNRTLSRLMLLLLAGLPSSALYADWQLNLPRGVTPISEDIFGLHMFAFWVCVGIGVVVFGVLTYALIFHRKSRGHEAADFHEHTTVEVLWAIIPLIILIIMAVPATAVLVKMHDANEAALTVKVTGYQWKWRYDYLNHHVGYYSNLKTPLDEIYGKAKKNPNYLLQVDKPLILPTNRKIRFLITSNDVIHSWWIPDLGLKKDAVPGFVHESWTLIKKPGIYRGQCAELCGVNHAFMPIVIVAKPPEEFDAWLKQQEEKVKSQQITSSKTLTQQELMDIGQQTYQKYCSVCHQPNGEGVPPTFPKLKGSPIATGDLQKHIDVVLHGVKDTTMQAFDKQLTPTELAAVITYERNAWGNDMGDQVQPDAIRKQLSEKGISSTQITMPDYSTVDKATQMKQGRKIYQQYCASCHGDQGEGKAPLYPALNKIATQPMEQQLTLLLNGKAGTQMPGFRQWLSPAELAAIMTYQNNAWNNDQGATITTTQIKQALERIPEPTVVPTTTKKVSEDTITTKKPTSDTKKTDTDKKTAKPSAKLDKAQLMEQGKKVYLQYCSVCHQPDGKGNPPVFPPLVGSAMLTGPVDQHINIVLKGKAGTSMQGFATQLSAEELAAVITYERNAWNDNKGGVVTVDDIKQAQGGS